MCFFFFQAEDGIRDLVLSRGLGDVYKRQGHKRAKYAFDIFVYRIKKYVGAYAAAMGGLDALAVSYTHLTLLTSDLV